MGEKSIDEKLEQPEATVNQQPADRKTTFLAA